VSLLRPIFRPSPKVGGEDETSLHMHKQLINKLGQNPVATGARNRRVKIAVDRMTIIGLAEIGKTFQAGDFLTREPANGLRRCLSLENLAHQECVQHLFQSGSAHKMPLTRQ
jgi:hypothetical protein